MPVARRKCAEGLSKLTAPSQHLRILAMRQILRLSAVKGCHKDQLHISACQHSGKLIEALSLSPRKLQQWRHAAKPGWSSFALSAPAALRRPCTAGMTACVQLLELLSGCSFSPMRPACHPEVVNQQKAEAANDSCPEMAQRCKTESRQCQKRAGTARSMPRSTPWRRGVGPKFLTQNILAETFYFVD